MEKGLNEIIQKQQGGIGNLLNREIYMHREISVSVMNMDSEFEETIQKRKSGIKSQQNKEINMDTQVDLPNFGGLSKSYIKEHFLLYDKV